MTNPGDPFDPKLDLRLERSIDVPPRLVWAAWTEPGHLKEWFAPRPWTVAECTVDLRPGGRFRTVMRSPEGEEFPGDGCFLEVVPQRRLVFTDALLPGYRPSPSPFFTTILSLEPKGDGTRYVATAMHAEPDARARHEEMGFAEGWGQCLDQLVEMVKGW